MKNSFLTCVGALLLVAVNGATQAAISTVDLVTVLNGNVAEAVFYYENNWKPYRKEALSRGYISDFTLMVDASTAGKETILLITEYPDDESYTAREENFARVMPQSGGPKLMNDKKPGMFRAVTDLGVFESQ